MPPRWTNDVVANRIVRHRAENHAPGGEPSEFARPERSQVFAVARAEHTLKSFLADDRSKPCLTRQQLPGEREPSAQA